jgi:hypothetical protein
MEKQESFVFYIRQLYDHARKIYKEPVQKELNLSNVFDKDILPDSWTETASFVVDWEVRDVEIRKFGKNYIPDAEEVFFDGKAESSSASPNINRNDAPSFIADW